MLMCNVLIMRSTAVALAAPQVNFELPNTSFVIIPNKCNEQHAR